MNLLMWEICKNKEDSEKEVVRTVKYVEDTIAELKNMENQQNTFQVDGFAPQFKLAQCCC